MSKSLHKKAEQAKDIFNDVLLENLTRSASYWLLAEKLYKLKKGNLYKFVFGDSVTSWRAFLSEANIPVSTADQRVRNYEYYIVNKGIDVQELIDLDVSCLYRLIGKLESEEATEQQVVEWLDRVRHLSRSDFLKELRGEDCIHEGQPVEITVLKCGSCGSKMREIKR